MATHSGVLAWRIPGMAEPGGLPSMGSHRVGHDWSNLAAAAISHCAYIWLPQWLSSKELVCNAGDTVWLLGWKISWRRKWQPTPLFLPGKSHGQRSLQVHGVANSLIWLSTFTKVSLRAHMCACARMCTHTHTHTSLTFLKPIIFWQALGLLPCLGYYK